MPTDVEKMEDYRAGMKEAVDLRDRIERLQKNADFKAVILEAFCVRDTARLVAESADPAMDPLQRADALSMAQAAGHLKRYLNLSIKMGDTAEQTIMSIDETLVEMRSEDAA